MGKVSTKNKIVWTILIAFSFHLVACSDVSLVAPEKPVVAVESKGDFCISEPDEVLKSTKFLFIVDKSGSNADTDPGGKKRSGNIESFVLSQKESEFLQYGVVVFGDGAEAYTTDESGAPGFTPSQSSAIKAARRISSEGDGGGTPYQSGLGMGRSLIANDIAKNRDADVTYIVFFISDGEPTDLDMNSDIGFPSFGDYDLETLDQLVDDIVSVGGKRIYLSTAFYGPNGDDAKDLLKRMSKRGKGKYVNFEENENWDFNDLIIKPDYEPWQLKTLLVYNISAGFCLDGSIATDSDGDGMCDKDEVELQKFGFDPRNRFSFGDGYGDYFHWLHHRYQKDLPPCTDRSDFDLDLLTYCEERFIENEDPNANPQMIHGDPLNPDTDYDGIIDGVETFVFFTRTRSFAMNPNNLSSVQYDFEEQAGEQIYQHRNPLVRDSQQAAYDADYWPESKDDIKTCYGFKMNTLPLYETLEVSVENTLPGLAHKAGENVVLIYYLQTYQDSPNGKAVYRYSYQVLRKNDLRTDTQAGLKVKDSIFETYIP
ncbi:MAG: VWA domain-containing protein [Bdellovibrionales bacterium]|nr:VWA domain-containing protein [Bdellovibrionales bacterium]